MKRTVAPAPHLRRVGLVIAIASLAAIGLATLLPQSGTPVDSHLCLVCGPLGGVSALLNVLLFIPLGVGLAISGFSGKRAIVLVCTLSALIETAQFLIISGRNSTIGDVLTNSIGGAIGFAIARNAFILLRPTPGIAMALTICWSIGWVAIQTVCAFGFTPALPRSVYYGQLARQLGDSKPFSGSIVRATIGDVEVPDTKFYDSRRVRELLIGGATVATTILPPESAHEIGPIVRVADASQREILLLAQNAADMVFGVRTGAAALRLRPPLFALPDVFGDRLTGNGRPALNTLTLSAAYSPREVWISAQSRVSDARHIPITAALGWTMLMPFQWFIERSRTELVVSAIWVAWLLLPIGYWLGCAMRFHRARDAAVIRITAMATAIASGFLYIGLIVVPQAFGVDPASPADWLAALAGILSGVVLALRGFAADPNVVGEAVVF